MKKGILAVVALAAATSVHAADYMLNVPVNVSNLTLGTALNLNCRLCTHHGGGQGPYCAAQSHQVVARHSAPVPLVNGSYSGTMQIVFTNLRDSQSDRPNYYGCDLSTPQHSAVGPQSGLPSTLIKPNSNPVTSTEGTLP